MPLPGFLRSADVAKEPHTVIWGWGEMRGEEGVSKRRGCMYTHMCTTDLMHPLAHHNRQHTTPTPPPTKTPKNTNTPQHPHTCGKYPILLHPLMHTHPYLSLCNSASSASLYISSVAGCTTTVQLVVPAHAVLASDTCVWGGEV